MPALSPGLLHWRLQQQAKGSPKAWVSPGPGSEEQLRLLFMPGCTGRPGSHRHCPSCTKPGCSSWPPPRQSAPPGTLPCHLKGLRCQLLFPGWQSQSPSSLLGALPAHQAAWLHPCLDSLASCTSTRGEGRARAGARRVLQEARTGRAC